MHTNNTHTNMIYYKQVRLMTWMIGGWSLRVVCSLTDRVDILVHRVHSQHNRTVNASFFFWGKLRHRTAEAAAGICGLKVHRRLLLGTLLSAGRTHAEHRLLVPCQSFRLYHFKMK